MRPSIAVAKSEDVSLSDFPRISGARACAPPPPHGESDRERDDDDDLCSDIIILFDAKSVSRVNGWGNSREDGPCVDHLSNSRA